ncbi:MAG: hypothetical protein VX899_06920 [Myxococcota bacterium]|nr:hypothetical protein [Myxococcota bacterium]
MTLWLALLACGPPAPELTLSPAEPTSADTLVAQTEPVDNGYGDDLPLVYQWSLDGEEVEGLEGPELGAGYTARGEEWTVQVWALDGDVEGRRAQATTIIRNAPPVATLAGQERQASDEHLSVSVNVIDNDGDDVTWSLRWSVDGQDSGETAEVLPPERTQPGEIWVATLDADDGQAAVQSTLEIEIY